VIDQQGYDLSIIEGIPYFYRQFGYAYATDHWTLDGLPSTWVPDRVLGGMAFPTVQLRPATLADLPTLQAFYPMATAGLLLHTLRSAEEWVYLLQAAEYPVYLVEPEDEENRPLGYVCGWMERGHPPMITIMESALPSAATALAVLHFCKQRAQEIRLGWPASGTLLQVARSLGSRFIYGDQWLLRIPDLPRLLMKLGPLFVQRLADSPWAGLTTDLTLNLYRQAYRLRFEQGALAGVDPLGFVDASMGADGGDLCIPPDAFTRLLLGYRTLDALRDAWPDIIVRASRRHLFDTLFPKFESYLWMQYMHCGHLLRLI
jgi:hypothetical protein